MKFKCCYIDGPMKNKALNENEVSPVFGHMMYASHSVDLI